MSGKSISAPVGIHGRNFYPDVMTVQYLLNCVPASAGGPVQELAVDGVSGAFTVQAIQRYQKVRFGWCDGRIDPEASGGITLRELKRYDPAPDSPPFTFGSHPGAPGPQPAVDTGCPRPTGKSFPGGKKHSGCFRAKKHSGI